MNKCCQKCIKLSTEWNHNERVLDIQFVMYMYLQTDLSALKCCLFTPNMNMLDIRAHVSIIWCLDKEINVYKSHCIKKSE